MGSLLSAVTYTKVHINHRPILNHQNKQTNKHKNTKTKTEQNKTKNLIKTKQIQKTNKQTTQQTNTQTNKQMLPGGALEYESDLGLQVPTGE